MGAAQRKAVADRLRDGLSKAMKVRAERREKGLCAFCGGPAPRAAKRRMALQARIAKLQLKLTKLGGAAPAGAIARPVHSDTDDVPIARLVREGR